MIFPVIIATVVGVTLLAYIVSAIGDSLGDYQDPSDWRDEDGGQG